MIENSDQPDEPKYKLSSFLFGNVDKQGEIEEYKNDEDLKAINNIDQCHVKEVEETTQLVLAPDSNTLNESDSVQPIQLSSDVHVMPVDYYDEQEAVPDELIDLKEIEHRDELIARSKVTDEDEYDEVPEPETTNSDLGNHQSVDGFTSASSTEAVDANSNVPADSTPTRKCSTPSFLDSGTPSPAADGIRYDKIEADNDTATESNQISPRSHTEPCIKLSDDEDASSRMPPPLRPAPVSLSRQHPSKTVSSRGPESPSSAGVGTLSSPIPTRVDSPATDRTVSPSSLNDPVTLNTPLGSLMPIEYANVEITELFPHYDPGRTPRWSRLFRLPHAPSTYREFIERAPLLNSLLEERTARSMDRLHLMYNDYLDLGQVPLESEIVLHDEVEELNTPLPPGSDCLAGHEKSWWRRAFTAALAEVTDSNGQRITGGKSAANDGSAVDESSESRTGKSVGKGNATSSVGQSNTDSKDLSDSVALASKDPNGENGGDKIMSHEEL
ncbi:unnamed protein product [Echinostoma caproni]|uniref:NARG2_C domain-containing protein n=1 Tax=Echinostoma caproni TaxID=27848 RepID=A0A183B1Z8_9TREM|nr:unnamed protein product [Echinostoma caproni]